MKYILILIYFISAQAYSVEWKFENWKNPGFKDLYGKYSAVLKGSKNNKILLLDGPYGKAVRFDGSCQLKVENSDVVSLKNNFTISCIFKPDKISGYRTLLWKGNRSLNPQQINYYLDFKDGKPEFKFKELDGKWVIVASSKALIKIGKWYYLTVTMDVNGKISGYLNGTYCLGKDYQKPLATNNQPLYIGAGESYYGGGFGYAFSGLIDQVSISAGVHPPSTGKVADFKYRAKIADDKANKARMLKRNTYIKTIKASGQVQKNLLNMTMDELESMVKSIEYKKFFTEKSNNMKMIVSVLPTASRMLKVRDYSSGKFKLKSKAVISAARNEYEGFQIVLLGNPKREIKDIKINLSELKSASGKVIPAYKLEWGVVRSIKTSKPKYDVDFVGYYPDPIMEGQQKTVTVPQSGFALVYVRVHIDKDVEPGNYAGKIKVGSKTVDIDLKVYDFTLPVTNSCKVIFSFFEGNYRKWYNKKKLSDKEKMYIYDFLLKYRITPNNIYSGNIYPELKYLAELKKKGANFCTLGYLRQKKAASQEELKKILSSYRKKLDLLKNIGFEKQAYLYAFDELSTQNKAERKAAKQIMTMIKKEFPELKTIQTSPPYPALLDDFKVWVPSFSYFVGHDKQIEDLKKRHKILWWYSADGPLKPFPNFFMDYPLLDNRVIFTLSYMYDIDGVLYWCINREWTTNMDIKGEWPEKPWKPYIISYINNKRQRKNGMGNYVYPGKDGRILPSLRLENLRDGIEDYEYLTLLKKLTANCRDKKLAAEAEKLLKVPENVAVAVNNYSANPDNLMKYRNDIALMIEKLKEK